MTLSRTVLHTAALFWELLHTATVTLVTSPFRMVITVVDKGTDNYFIYGPVHTHTGFHAVWSPEREHRRDVP